MLMILNNAADTVRLCRNVNLISLCTVRVSAGPRWQLNKKHRCPPRRLQMSRCVGRRRVCPCTFMQISNKDSELVGEEMIYLHFALARNPLGRFYRVNVFDTTSEGFSEDSVMFGWRITPGCPSGKNHLNFVSQHVKLIRWFEIYLRWILDLDWVPSASPPDKQSWDVCWAVKILDNVFLTGNTTSNPQKKTQILDDNHKTKGAEPFHYAWIKITEWSFQHHHIIIILSIVENGIIQWNNQFSLLGHCG